MDATVEEAVIPKEGEWSIVRVRAGGSVFYIANSPQDFVWLSRNPRRDGSSRAVFLRDEIQKALAKVEAFDMEQRHAWLREACEVKLAFPGSHIDAVGKVGDFDAENYFTADDVLPASSRSELGKTDERQRHRDNERGDAASRKSLIERERKRQPNLW